MKAYKKPASPLAASEQGGSFGFGRARRADPPGASRARKGCGSDRLAAFAGRGCIVFEARAGGDGRSSGGSGPRGAQGGPDEEPSRAMFVQAEVDR